jgi:hypothetical protein
MSQLTLDPVMNLTESHTDVFGEIIVRSTEDDFFAYSTRGTQRIDAQGCESVVGFGDTAEEALADFWDYATEEGTVLYVQSLTGTRAYMYDAESNSFVLLFLDAAKKHPEYLGAAS